MSAVFVISLDFELLWGVKDHRSIASYGKAIQGGREAILQMLELFRKEEIHVTWATVGLLMFDQKEELIKTLPNHKPVYKNNQLSNYVALDQVGENESVDSYHFGKSLLDKIINTPHQEVSSHTFSHYYCLEAGQSKEDFDADTEAFVKRCTQLHIQPVSIVFPRNQYNPSYLSVLKKYLFSSFRGNESHPLYAARSRERETKVRRLIRLMDGYFNLSGHHTYLLSNLKKEEGLLNIPSSRFLRPYYKTLSFLEGKKIHRIKQSMKHAAVTGEVFHLWWHPHNFGTHSEQMMKQLQEIVAYYKVLHKQFGMQSMNMREVSDHYHQTNRHEA